MSSEIEILKRKIDRERASRIEAEKLLEVKSLELYDANKRLSNLLESRTKKLRTSEKEYQTLIENINEIICKTTLSGTITYINPIVTSLTGYKHSELVGSNIFNIVEEKYRKKAYVYFGRQQKNGYCFSYKEIVIKTKDNDKLWLGLNVQFYGKECLTCANRLSAITNKTNLNPMPHCKYSEVIIVARNITEQKQTEKLLIEQSRNLERGLIQQELLSEIALEINTQNTFESKINLVLKRIGLHTNVSRVYIFENSESGKTISNTFEWCNEGIKSQIKKLQEIPYDTIPSWKPLLDEDGKVYSENIHELPQDLIDFMEPQNIKSVLAYPIYINAKYFGFIGFDECNKRKSWKRTELELLRTVSGIIANTFERRKAEISLLQSESKNRAILESIPDTLFHFNSEGKILGYRISKQYDLSISPEKFINKKIDKLFSDDFSARMYSSIQKCLKEGAVKFEYSMQVKDTIQEFEARMTKMNDTEVITIIRNVTERKDYERKLTTERDKAHKANIAKSEFLANMSHEIRTPMNAILGFSEALYHKMDLPQHKKMLKSILSSGNLLLSLLNDILDLSKIEAGKMEMSPQPVNINELIDEIIMLFIDKAQSKGISIEVKTNLDNTIPLLIDEIRIKQVLFNLIGNAIKFTHKGEICILLNTNKITNDLFNLKIAISDTGIGIDKKEQAAIFDTFQQQTGQSTRKYGGAGLGLAISKRLIEKMGGHIALKSEQGKGSEFTIIIPNVKKSSTKVKKKTDHTLDEKLDFLNASLFIIDDVQTNIDTIDVLLSDSGILTEIANNGKLALQKLKNFTPDIIFLDLRMPDMDGYQVAKKIKSTPHLTEIPIIAYTASVLISEEIKKSALFNGFLSKPANKKDICSILKQYIPYNNITEEKVPEITGFSLSELPEKVLTKLPEIENSLNNQLFTEWKKIKDTFVLYEIESFVNDLKTFANEFEFDYLNNYAQNMVEDLETIDLDSLKTNLNKFPDIIKTITASNHKEQ
jgi:PAS domain S-box-containing protein